MILVFWLSQFGKEFESLLAEIKHIDPYFFPLTEQKTKLSELMNKYF